MLILYRIIDSVLLRICVVLFLESILVLFTA